MAKKIDIYDKIILGSFFLIILSFFLPWIKIPILGSFNIINSLYGVILFFIYLVIIALFFFKKQISKILALSLNSSILLFVLYKLITNLDIFKTLDLGILGKISIFTFINIGVYLFFVGILINMIFIILNFIKSKLKTKNISICIALIIFFFLVLFFLSNNLNLNNSDQFLNKENSPFSNTEEPSQNSYKYIENNIYQEEDLDSIRLKAKECKFDFNECEKNYVFNIPVKKEIVDFFTDEITYEDIDLNLIIWTPYLKSIYYFSDKEKNYEDYTDDDIKNYLNSENFGIELDNSVFYSTSYKDIGKPENIVIFYKNEKFNGKESYYSLSNDIDKDFNGFLNYANDEIGVHLIGDSGEIEENLNLGNYK